MTLTTEKAGAARFYDSLNDATAKIERDKPFWLKHVKQEIYDILEVRDEFSANDLKDLEIPQVFANLIGIAVNSVARSGRMKKHGHTTSEMKSRHGAEIKTYLITDYGRSLRTFSGPGQGPKTPATPVESPSPREAAAPFDRVSMTDTAESGHDRAGEPESEPLRLFEENSDPGHIDEDQRRRAA